MKKHLLTIAIAVSAFICGSFLGPKKTEVKEVEKIVYREKSDTKSKTNRNTVKKEVRRPDGTIEIETRTQTKNSTDKKTNKSLDQEKKKEAKTENRPDWRAHVIYFPELPGYQDKSATIDLQRRILSELYLGIAVTTEKQVGLSISIGF